MNKEIKGIKTYDLGTETIGEHLECIYCYVNKTNGKKYVGKAKDLRIRHRGHMYSTNNEKDKAYNFPIHKALRKYGEEGFLLVVLDENLEANEAINEKEQHYISTLNSLAKDGKGYNIARGGTGGWTLEGKTPEEIEAWRQKVIKNLPRRSGKDHPFYGKHHTEEAKQRMREALSGENSTMHRYGGHSKETIQKIIESRKWYRGDKHQGSKKVNQYSIEGKFIKEWSCISEVNRETGINAGSICKSCKTKKHRAGGYLWRYTEEFPNHEDIEPYQEVNRKRPNPKCRKPVVQLDLEGNYIRTWESAAQAGEELNIVAANITMCCKKKYKQAKGYIWRYEKEYFEEERESA